MDMFTGTDNGGDISVDSVWTNEKIAYAVANSKYAHSVMDYEVNEGDEVPEYAKEAYDKIIKTGKLDKWAK